VVSLADAAEWVTCSETKRSRWTQPPIRPKEPAISLWWRGRRLWWCASEAAASQHQAISIDNLCIEGHRALHAKICPRCPWLDCNRDQLASWDRVSVKHVYIAQQRTSSWEPLRRVDPQVFPHRCREHCDHRGAMSNSIQILQPWGDLHAKA